MSQQTMCVARTNGPSEEEWTIHRPLLTRLYHEENKTLDQVMAIMAGEHEFVAKKNQFETHLRGKWKLKKKTKASVWRVIAPILFELERTGRPFELWIDGEKKPSQTYRKEIRRYRGSCDHLPIKMAWNNLPAGVIIREVVPPTENLTAIHLPFHSFEQYLSDTLPIFHARRPNDFVQPASISEYAVVKSFDWDEQFFRTLEPVTLDAHDYNEASQVPRALFDSQVFSPNSYRSVMFSLANNCACLPVLPTAAIRWILKQATVGVSLGTLVRTKRHPSLMTILKNLYRMSLQNGDSVIVDFLLRQSIPGIESNRHKSSCETSPLDIAVRTGCHDLVGVLLKHGAEPEETTYRILKGTSRGRKSTDAAFQMRNWLRIDELLIKHGAVKDVSFLKTLIRHEGSEDLVAMLLTRGVISQYQTWMSRGVFHDIFWYQKHGVMLQAAKIMLDHDLSPNQSYRTWSLESIIDLGCFDGILPNSRTLIDIVCYRGDLTVFKLLLMNGAKLTASTLWEAILGGCKSLVQLVLDQNLGVKDIREYWDTTMALAIQQDRSDISEIILPYFSEAAERFGVSLLAAATKGNWSLFEDIYGMDAHLGWTERGNSRCHLTWDSDSHLAWNCDITKIVSNILSCCVRDGQDCVVLQVLRKASASHPTLTPLSTEREDICHADAMAGVELRQSWEIRAEREGERGREDLECPLSEALKLRSTAMVSLLLDASAAKYRYHGLNESYPTPLYHAVKWGNISVIKSIINDSQAADVRSNRQAFNAAIALGDLDMIYLLLDAGLEIKSHPESDFIRSSSMKDINRTVLESAVLCGNVKILQCVLHAGADPHDARALWQAFRREGPMLDLILQAHTRVYPMGRRRWGREILMTTIRSGNMELLKKMIDAGADAKYIANEEVEFCQDISAFGYATATSAENGIGAVEYLLQEKHKTNCGAETIVSQIVVSDNLLYQHPVSKKLVPKTDAGRFSWSDTAFLVAVKHGHVPTIELLMRHNADVNYPARMHVRLTPLQQAADYGNIGVVQLLLEHGAEVNGLPARKGGGTALQLAAMRGYTQIVKLVLNRGADIHAPGSLLDGRTALEAAAEHGRLDTVALLLQRSDKFATTYKKDADSATRYARRNGHDEVVSLIEEHISTNSQTFDDLFDFAAGEVEGSEMSVD